MVLEPLLFPIYKIAVYGDSNRYQDKVSLCKPHINSYNIRVNNTAQHTE